MLHTLLQCRIQIHMPLILNLGFTTNCIAVRQCGCPTGGYFELNGCPYQQIVTRGELMTPNFQPCIIMQYCCIKFFKLKHKQYCEIRGRTCHNVHHFVLLNNNCQEVLSHLRYVKAAAITPDMTRT